MDHKVPFTLYTARYKNPAVPRGAGKIVPVRITLGAPKFGLGYALGGNIQELHPSGWLFNIHGRDQFEPKYHEHLDRIGIAKVRQRLIETSEANGGKDLVLLCYERVDQGGWCHRLCFSTWWESRTGQPVLELPEPADAPPERPKLLQLLLF